MFSGFTEYLKNVDRLPTAIFALNDHVAIGAIAALHDAGLRVPQDVALVGFDDISPASIVRPALTTVSQMHLPVGQMAVDTTLEQIERSHLSPTHIRLMPKLVIRESCGAQRALADGAVGLSTTEEKDSSSPAQSLAESPRRR